jgi:hypothetical protein
MSLFVDLVGIGDKLDIVRKRKAAICLTLTCREGIGAPKI